MSGQQTTHPREQFLSENVRRFSTGKVSNTARKPPRLFTPQELRMGFGGRTGQSMRSKICQKPECRLGRRVRVRGFVARSGSSLHDELFDLPPLPERITIDSFMLTDFQRVCYPDSEKQPAERLSVNLFDKEKIRDALLSHVANVLQIKTGSNAIPSRDAVRTIPVDAKLHRFQYEEKN